MIVLDQTGFLQNSRKKKKLLINLSGLLNTLRFHRWNVELFSVLFDHTAHAEFRPV